MNKIELSQWLNIEGNNVDVQIPNEIFEDLESLELKTWKHKGFAYAYYYLITYIYRNTLYSLNNPDEYNQEQILKSIASTNRKLFYITKKNGLLEKLGYIKTTNNYPTSFYMDNSVLSFTYSDDLKKEVMQLPEVSTNFSIKEPVKALNRFDEDFTGTFYDFQNTHRIPIQRFIDIITNENLGYVGLYIYGYLSMMNDRFPSGYQTSNTKLAEFIGCNERTLAKYTKELEEKGFVKSERKLLGYKLLEKIYNVI